MNRKDRTTARRRTALGLGTAAAAAMTATFMSMGTAQADGDPFSDFASAVGNTNPLAVTGAATLDATLHTQYLGTNIDAFVDNPSTIPSTLPTTDPTSNDVFTDLLPANATADQMAEAARLDNYIVNPNDTALIATLNTQADLIPSGTTPPTTDLDPFEDALPSTATPAQIAQATAADAAFASANPTGAAQLDAAVDAGNLPVGSSMDADAFSDLGLVNGAALDAAFPGLAQSLDPLVDTIPAITPDLDAVSDLIGSLDPNAFTAAGTPQDFLGVLAAGLDSLLAPTGLENLLDPLVDNLAGVGSTSIPFFPFP
jgi:hypothetical protein